MFEDLDTTPSAPFFIDAEVELPGVLFDLLARDA